MARQEVKIFVGSQGKSRVHYSNGYYDSETGELQTGGYIGPDEVTYKQARAYQTLLLSEANNLSVAVHMPDGEVLVGAWNEVNHKFTQRPRD